MHNTDVWSDIDRMTKNRLKDARIRKKNFFKMVARSSNLLFGLVALALVTTVIHILYQSPAAMSLETKIHIGSVITDKEVPLVAEAHIMRRSAMERARRMESDQVVTRYAERFDIEWEMARLVSLISESEGVDPDLIFNVIWVESQFNPKAVGKVGEIGLMQVRPETALTIDPGSTVEKLFDPAYNIRIGIKHLKDHLHFYRGDINLALLAYNRGRGTINSLLMLGENPSNGYAARVLNNNVLNNSM